MQRCIFKWIAYIINKKIVSSTWKKDIFVSRGVLIQISKIRYYKEIVLNNFFSKKMSKTRPKNYINGTEQYKPYTKCYQRSKNKKKKITEEDLNENLLSTNSNKWTPDENKIYL